MVNADILQEVEEAKVPEVLEVLKGDGDWPFSFLMHQTIKMMQDFKKSNYNNIKQRLFSVGGKIDGGAFVVLSTFKEMNRSPEEIGLDPLQTLPIRHGSTTAITYVHVYTSGDDAPDVAQALQSDIVPWSTDLLVFDVVYGSVRPYVLSALKGKGVKYTEATNSLYWVNPEDQHKLDERTPPSDVTVMFLNEGHAKEINDKWPLKFPDSENVIKDTILSSFGMGVVRKSDRKLLCHALCNHAGALFILHTEPEAQDKGYAALLVSNVVKESLKRGRNSVAIVANRDTATEEVLKNFDFVPFIPTKYYAVTKT